MRFRERGAEGGWREFLEKQFPALGMAVCRTAPNFIQVWHSHDPDQTVPAECRHPTFNNSCPALCEKPADTIGMEMYSGMPHSAEALFCSIYYATILLVVFHSPVEHLLCNEFILWINNGMDHDALKLLKNDWLTHPSCGVVLLAMLSNEKFSTRSPPLTYNQGRPLQTRNFFHLAEPLEDSDLDRQLTTNRWHLIAKLLFTKH